MRIKHRGKVGIDMKRMNTSAQTVSYREMSSAISANNAVRFIFAQLFFAFFSFSPIPV